MPTEMKLPELGENVESGDVLRVLVKPGDRVNASPGPGAETPRPVFGKDGAPGRPPKSGRGAFGAANQTEGAGPGARRFRRHSSGAAGGGAGARAGRKHSGHSRFGCGR